MKSIGFIPIRKGSKGIINKNKIQILGRPLYQWVLSEAIFSILDEVYLFTDDDELIENANNEYAWTNKIKILKRNSHNASDTASTEAAMLEFSARVEFSFDILVLLQATSPLTTRIDINNALQKLNNEDINSVLSVVNSKRFLWNANGTPINYDFTMRPRRQDFKGLLIENGAIYAIKKETYLKNKQRLAGNIGLLQMPDDTLIEIDEKIDLIVIEQLLLNRLQKNKTPVDKIKAVVLDVDGVLTNGKVSVSIDGEFSKDFSLRDGMGLSKIKALNILPIVMTSEISNIVDHRMKKLGIAYFYSGVKDKFSRLEHLLFALKIHRNSVAYLGDDINDLANIVSCGWGICPHDADPAITQNADLQLTNLGGNHLVREFTNFIINYNKKFDI